MMVFRAGSHEFDDLARLIYEGAQSLFRQQKYSNGYISQGNSNLAEANIVIHVASSFFSESHSVWAESPFKKDEQASFNRLDLLVDLSPGESEYPTILLIEGKRIAPGEERVKIEEIIVDFDRIRGWKSLPGGCRPLYFEMAPKIERIYGAIVVVLPEEPYLKPDTLPVERVTDPTLSQWWQDFEHIPAKYPADSLQRLRLVLARASKRNVAHSPYADGGPRMAVLYAIFDFGKM